MSALMWGRTMYDNISPSLGMTLVLCTVLPRLFADARAPSFFSTALKNNPTAGHMNEMSFRDIKKELGMHMEPCATAWTGEIAGQCPEGSTKLMLRRQAGPFAPCVGVGCVEMNDSSLAQLVRTAHDELAEEDGSRCRVTVAKNLNKSPDDARPYSSVATLTEEAWYRNVPAYIFDPVSLTPDTFGAAQLVQLPLSVTPQEFTDKVLRPTNAVKDISRRNPADPDDSVYVARTVEIAMKEIVLNAAVRSQHEETAAQVVAFEKKLQEEQDQIAKERKQIATERQQLSGDREAMVQERQRMTRRVDALEHELNDAHVAYQKLQNELNDTRVAYQKLKNELNDAHVYLNDTGRKASDAFDQAILMSFALNHALRTIRIQFEGVAQDLEVSSHAVERVRREVKGDKLDADLADALANAVFAGNGAALVRDFLERAQSSAAALMDSLRSSYRSVSGSDAIAPPLMPFDSDVADRFPAEEHERAVDSCDDMCDDRKSIRCTDSYTSHLEKKSFAVDWSGEGGFPWLKPPVLSAEPSSSCTAGGKFASGTLTESSQNDRPAHHKRQRTPKDAVESKADASSDKKPSSSSLGKKSRNGLSAAPAHSDDADQRSDREGNDSKSESSEASEAVDADPLPAVDGKKTDGSMQRVT